MRIEHEPRALEDVSLDDALMTTFDLLMIAESKQSKHPARLVAPNVGEERVAELRSMPYRDFLMTDEWKATSYDMKWKAKNRCEGCGADEGLEVHHLTYERRGAELASDLIVLCHRCHMSFHRVMPE